MFKASSAFLACSKDWATALLAFNASVSDFEA